MVFQPKFKSLGFKHLVYRLFNGHCIRIQLQLTFFFPSAKLFFHVSVDIFKLVKVR